VRLLDPGNCVTLASRAMIDLATVTLGGEPATATTTDTQLTACGAGWAADTELVLAADLTLAPGTWAPSQVGFSITNDGGGKPLTYLLSWVQQCDRLLPCDASRPARSPRYGFTSTTPPAPRCCARARSAPAPTSRPARSITPAARPTRRSA
jgi:hypothetical protein